MTVLARTGAHDIGERTAHGVLGFGLFALVVLGVYMGRGLPFVVDEWNILANYATGGWLEPYNGHLSLVPVAFYQGLARVMGLQPNLLYGLVGLGILVAIPLGWYRYHRGTLDLRLAVLGALAIAWAPAASNAVIYPMLMVFTIPALALVVSWRLLGRDRAGADWAAAAVLAVALATSAAGIIVVVAVGGELILGRARPRRLVPFVVPVLVWGVWWLFHHDPTAPASLADRLRYAADMTVAILSGFTLGFKPGAIPVGIGLIVLLVCARRFGNFDAHLGAMVLALVCFVGLSAYSRAGLLALNPPDSLRYVWFGGLLIIEIGASCIRNRRIPSLVPALGAAAVLVGAVGMVGNVRDDRALVMGFGNTHRAWLVGAEAAGPEADRDRILPLNAIPVSVGEYLDLVDRVGSPVGDVDFDDLGKRESRRGADAILIDEEGLSVVAAGATSCANGSVPTPSESFEIPPGSTLVVTAGADTVKLTARRFALPRDATSIGQVPAHGQADVATSPDGSSLPWIIDVRGPPVRAAVCTDATDRGHEP